MTAKILTYIAPLNSNSQCPISNLKGIYNAKQELVPIKKYGKCYIQATALPPDFVIASPKNFHRRVWLFAGAVALASF